METFTYVVGIVDGNQREVEGVLVTVTDNVLFVMSAMTRQGSDVVLAVPLAQLQYVERLPRQD